MMIIAGAGTGDERSLTLEVRDALIHSDVIVAHSRFKNLIPPHKRVIDLTNFHDALSQLEHEHGNKLILLSGDPCLYSLLPIIKRRFPNEDIRVLPGISSLQELCARACESWSDAVILSGHGRSLRAGTFMNIIARNRLVLLFCDRNISPKWACQNLMGDSFEVYIGCELGSANERIIHGRPSDFAARDFPELSVMLIRNHDVYVPEQTHLRDSDFLREPGIVMTNESVRAVILSRLNLNHDSILWDIGAGSGSVSISAGHENIHAEMHAVEYKPEALSLIARNISRFHTHNVHVHSGRALDVLPSLPEPTHVFIGGTEGELSGILEHLSRMNRPVHVMIACVTLETLNTAYEALRDWDNFEAVSVSVSASKSLAPFMTMMKAQNPVMLLSAITKQKFID